MTYGTPDGPNMTWLIHWLERCSVIPVFGNSRSLQHFVHLQMLPEEFSKLWKSQQPSIVTSTPLPVLRFRAKY